MARFNLAFTSGLLVPLVVGALISCAGSVSNTTQGSGGTTGATATGGDTAKGSGEEFPIPPGPGGTNGTGGTIACPDGTERCACYGNGTCNVGLTCASNLCVRLGTGGASAFGGGPSGGDFTVSTNAGGQGGTSATGDSVSLGGTTAAGGATGSDASGGQSRCLSTNPAAICDWVGPAGCGDGSVNQTSEVCDDGNAVPGDGCSGLCQVEPNCVCPPQGGACALSFVCGDGVVNPGEQCDQGSYQDKPGCSADCKTQDPGYRCRPAERCVASTSLPQGNCGDGMVQPDLGEQCDYYAAQNDGTYGGCNSTCTLAPHCGDGVRNGPEQCDYGSALNTGDYGGCTRQCQMATHCGDGIKNGPEECDDGTGSTGNGTAQSRCTTACKNYVPVSN